MAFRLKAGVSPDEVESLLAAIRGLPAAVPGILELQCGTNFSPARAHGYDLGLRVRFVGRAELEAYGPHPAHQPVLARVRELCDDVLALDFES